MRLLRGEGASLPGGRTRYRWERTRNRGDGAVTGRTVSARGAPEMRRGLRGRELGDDATAEQAAVRVVQGARLPWRDGPHRLGEVEGDRPAHLLPHPAGNGRGAVAALYQNRIPRRQRVGEPVELRERHAVAEQLVPRADHDFARRSEEHTSELQSQSNLVCRLLLEKKKKKNTNSLTDEKRTQT